MMWKVPEALAMAEWDHITDVCVDACAFGAPWKKPTRLRFYRCATAAAVLDGCRCRAGNGGRCQWSGKRHVHLQGRDPRGILYTKRVAQYPRRLARDLAKIMFEAGFEILLPFSAGAEIVSS